MASWCHISPGFGAWTAYLLSKGYLSSSEDEYSSIQCNIQLL